MENGAHSEDSSQNIQNDYFNNARKNRTRITIFLTNGQRISGFIRSFDRFTVILETRNGDQMVFKHAITSVAAALAMEHQPGRGPRPPRPGAHDGHHPGPGGPPGSGDRPHREGRPPRHDGGEGPRQRGGGSGPPGKSFGNFMDLSSVTKGPGGTQPGGAGRSESAPAEPPKEPAPAPAPAPAPEAAPAAEPKPVSGEAGGGDSGSST